MSTLHSPPYAEYRKWLKKQKGLDPKINWWMAWKGGWEVRDAMKLPEKVVSVRAVPRAKG